MLSLGLNLLVAVLWLFLSPSPTLSTFTIGFLLGLALIAAFRDILPADAYVRRVGGFVRFFAVFVREFVRANFEMARIVLLARKEDLHPNFLTLDVAELEPWEILLLTHCISLTPGSTTVQVSEDFRTVTVHALDAKDPAEVRRRINETIRAAILGFSRP